MGCRLLRSFLESAVYEQNGSAVNCWNKSNSVQKGSGPREVRVATDLPLTNSGGRSWAFHNEHGTERAGGKGGSRGKAGAAGATGRSEDAGPPSRFGGNDVLQADDDSLFRTAKDQGGCRLLQRLLTDGTPEEVGRVFSMAFSSLVELMTDAYGNYLFQKLLDVCSDEQLRQLLQAVTPHLRDICLDPHGTRTAQKLVEVIYGSVRTTNTPPA